MTCSAPANASPPPSPAPTTGHAPTPPPPARRSPASGGSSPRSTATSPVWARKNAQPSAKPSPSSASTAPSASACPASARARRHPWRRPHDRHLAAERRRHAGHRDDQRPAGRLRPPPPARHHRHQGGGGPGVASVPGSQHISATPATGAVVVGSDATSLPTPGTLVSRDNNGSFSATNITLGGGLNCGGQLGVLNLPTTTANAGMITLGGCNIPFLHAYGFQNFFGGVNAGNLTLTGSANRSEE